MPRLRPRRAGTARTASRQSGEQPAPGRRSVGVDQPAPRISPRLGGAHQGRDAVAARPLPRVPGAVRSGAGCVARANRQRARAPIAAHPVGGAGTERVVYRGRTRGRAGTSGRGQLIAGLTGGAEPSHRQRVVAQRPRAAGRSARGSRAAPGGADTEAARRGAARRALERARPRPHRRRAHARARPHSGDLRAGRSAGARGGRGGAPARRSRLLRAMGGRARDRRQPLCRRGQRPDVAGRPARPAQQPGRVLHRLVRSWRPSLLDRRRTTPLDRRHRELCGGAATGAPLRVCTGRASRRSPTPTRARSPPSR